LHSEEYVSDDFKRAANLRDSPAGRRPEIDGNPGYKKKYSDDAWH
jgi:hypothetical protein